MTITPSAPSTTAPIQQALLNLKLPGEAPAPVDPQQVSNTIAAQQQPQQPEPQPAVDLPFFGEEQVEVKPAVEQPAVEQPQPQADGVEDDEADLPVNPAAENFKKLRTIAKEARQAKREQEQVLQQVQAELERYKKGEIVPDIITAKDQRIAELEKYEKMANIKLSPDYQKAFVEPAITLGSKLDDHAKSYGLEPDYLRQAVEITSPRELNRFLSQHFDDLGALEAKKIINELQDIGEKALQAEQEPETAMQELRAQFEQKEVEEAKKVSAIFESTAKTAWMKALDKTAKEGVYRELILDPNDSKHNKEVVEPIQTKSSQQFGALVTQLRKNGLKQLPEDLAVGLARMVQLGIAGAMALEAKAKAEAQLSKVMTTSRVVSPYIRPSINGSPGAQPTRTQTAPTSFQEAGRLAAARLKT